MYIKGMLAKTKYTLLGGIKDLSAGGLLKESSDDLYHFHSGTYGNVTPDFVHSKIFFKSGRSLRERYLLCL